MSNYVTILDTTGRNILGTLARETETEIDILNPVMITVQPQNQQFQVQLIPLFLAEFIAPGADNLRNFTYSYAKSNIALGKGFEIDTRITSQYDKIIEATNNRQPAPVKGNDPEVIKLFDD
jgi:hypothetical protein